VRGAMAVGSLRSSGFQSSGGKCICQKKGEGCLNSSPTSVCRASLLATKFTVHSTCSCVTVLTRQTSWPASGWTLR
jgi:hypothetical protein